MNDARDALAAIGKNTAEWQAKVIVAAHRALPREWRAWATMQILNDGTDDEHAAEIVRRWLNRPGVGRDTRETVVRRAIIVALGGENGA